MNAFDFIAARTPITEARDPTQPSPLLTHLAGPHAERIARVWPAPHLEFLALPASRRHIAAIALWRVRPDEAATVRGLIDRAPLRDVLAYAVRNAPRGLPRALSRLGEALWPHHAYDRLLSLLGEPAANLVLRHVDAITPSLLERLDVLPEALRTARIAANIETVEAARALAEAFAAARWINPKRQERDLVAAWGRASGPEALLRAGLEVLKPDRFGGMTNAPEMAKPYRRIASRALLEETALRFRNCAAGYVWETGADEMALYIWEADVPALIALKRDIGGWRLAEALGIDNSVLTDDALAILVADFTRAGVRAGPPVRSIEDRLEALADNVGVSQPPPQSYRAQLGLGQLWR
jgi:hypothetical protein